MVRVLIVDDSDVQSQALGVLLQDELGAQVVARAATAREAVYFADGCDVALVNAATQALDTKDVVYRISHEHPGVKVLMLGVPDPDSHVNGLLDYVGAGACGYISATDSMTRALRKIKAASEDRALISPRFAMRLMRHLASLHSQESGEPLPSEEEVRRLTQLTPRQREVLALIAQEYTNAAIADELCITVGTVKNHVSRILKVLGAPNRERAALVFRARQEQA